MSRIQELNTPEGLRAGDKIGMEVNGRTMIYTVRNVIFGLRYVGDERGRVVVTFEEHHGVLCIPSAPLDLFMRDSRVGFKRAYRLVPDYDEWADIENARGALGGTPDTLPCYECTRAAGGDVSDDRFCIRQPVVALGPIAEAHRDPTQTYKLACGHTVI